MSDCCLCQWLIIFILIFLSFVILKILLPKAPNQLKLSLIYVLIFLLTSCSVPFMLLRPKDYRNMLIPTAVFRKFAEYVGYDIKVRGQENIKPGNGCIVIINHQSVLDILIIAHLWRLFGRVTVIAKNELKYFPGLGQFLWLGGALFIDRKKPTKAIDKLNEESRAIKEENVKILVFPEGTRSLKTTLLPFKKGCFHLAIQNQCPIQPVVVSQYKFLIEKTEAGINHIIINILEEIPTTGVDVDNMVEFIDRCRNVMQNECNRLNMELENKFSDNKINNNAGEDKKSE